MLEQRTINNIKVFYCDIDDFKINRITINYNFVLRKGFEVSIINLLAKVLNYELLHYTQDELIKKKLLLNDLYIGYKYDLSGPKCSFTLNMDYCDMKFLNNPNFLKDCLDLMSEYLLYPKIVNGSFDKKVFKECKQSSLDNAAISMRKQEYIANDLFQSTITKDSYYDRATRIGYEQVSKVTNKQLVKLFNKIKERRMSINIIGKVDMDLVENWIKETFPNYVEPVSRKVNVVYKQNEYIEKEDTNETFKQAVINKLYTYDKPSHPKSSFLSLSHLAYSYETLFKNIREDKGLCYNISGSFDQRFRTFKITCLCEKSKVDECNQAIDEYMDKVISEGFSEEAFDIEKKNAIKNYSDYTESTARINSLFLAYESSKTPFTGIDKLIKEYKRAKCVKGNATISSLKLKTTTILK